MIKKIVFASILAFLFLFLNDEISIAQNMKEGLWEITMTMEVLGMPMKMPPQSYTHCITKKDMIPQKQEPDQECKVIKHDVRGDTVTWVVECKTPEGKAVSNGKVTYKGTTFEGVVKVKHAGMEVTQNLKGKWIGKCR